MIAVWRFVKYYVIYKYKQTRGSAVLLIVASMSYTLLALY